MHVAHDVLTTNVHIYKNSNRLSSFVSEWSFPPSWWLIPKSSSASEGTCLLFVKRNKCLTPVQMLHHICRRKKSYIWQGPWPFVVFQLYIRVISGQQLGLTWWACTLQHVFPICYLTYFIDPRQQWAKKKNLLNHKSFNCTSLLKQEKVTNFERFSNTFVTKKKCHVKLSVIWRNIFPDSRYKRPPNIHLISEQIIFPDHWFDDLPFGISISMFLRRNLFIC